MKPLLSLVWLMMSSVVGLQRVKYVEQSLNWYNARAYCREHYVDLLTIRTEEENNQLNEDTWLGLYRPYLSYVWKWSDGDASSFRKPWKSGKEPGWSYSNCVYKYKGDGGPWSSLWCSVKEKFFCLDDDLFLVPEQKTWEEALAHCRSLTTSSYRYELASIITTEDHDYVRSQILGEVWTGLRFLGDHWVWVEGDTVDFSELSASCPSIKRCGMLNTTITENYSITECDQRKEFFCRKREIN